MFGRFIYTLSNELTARMAASAILNRVNCTLGLYTPLMGGPKNSFANAPVTAAKGP